MDKPEQTCLEDLTPNSIADGIGLEYSAPGTRLECNSVAVECFADTTGRKESYASDQPVSLGSDLDRLSNGTPDESNQTETYTIIKIEEPSADNDELDDELTSPADMQDSVTEVMENLQSADYAADGAPLHSALNQKLQKKRRRIVVLTNNCEDSSDDEDDQPELTRSPSPDVPVSPNPTTPSAQATTENQVPAITPESFEAIAKNDRPGPKSKKASTQLLKELHARALLQSAIVIPAAVDPKRRKIRILDDSDQESAPNDVDDIGLDSSCAEMAGNAPEDLLTVSNANLIGGDLTESGSNIGKIEAVLNGEGDIVGDGEMCMALELNVGDREEDDAEIDEKRYYEDNADSDRSYVGSNEDESSNHRDSGNSSDGAGLAATSKTDK